MKFLKTKLLVIPNKPENKTGGIIVHNKPLLPYTGTVVTFSEDLAPLMKEGDTILFRVGGGMPVPYQGKEALVLAEHDFIAVIEDEDKFFG